MNCLQLKLRGDNLGQIIHDLRQQYQFEVNFRSLTETTELFVVEIEDSSFYQYSIQITTDTLIIVLVDKQKIRFLFDSINCCRGEKNYINTDWIVQENDMKELLNSLNELCEKHNAEMFILDQPMQIMSPLNQIDLSPIPQEEIDKWVVAFPDFCFPE